MYFKNMVGQTFGKLTVLRLSRKMFGNEHCATWRCLCACGKVHIVRGYCLRRGQVKSCGCSKNTTTHGMTGTLEYTMWAHAKARAKEQGLDFDIEPKDVQIPRHCPILGIQLRASRVRVWASSPSLDRIDPRKGYVKGNIAVISFRANTIKQDATIDELNAVLGYVKRYSSLVIARKK